MSGPLDGRKPLHPADGVDADTVSRNGVSASSVSSVSGLDCGEVVHAYTRTDALADGVLVDVTDAASPSGMLGGFTVPVAVTAGLWTAIGEIPASLVGVADVRGRLHDVLWMASLACRRREGAFFASFAVRTFAVHLPYRGTRKRVQTLRVEIGPDDHGAPCLTIGFPEEF